MQKTNKDEKRLLATFSDKSMVIDPKFKQKLRKDVMKNNGKVRAGLRWPKLALVPALALLALVVVFGEIQKPEQGGSQVGPEKASAAELIQSSLEAEGSFDASKYNYFVSKTSMHYGPEMKYSCWGQSNAEDFKDNTSYTYVYQEKNNMTEAYYSSGSNEQKPAYWTVLDRTAEDIVPDNISNYSYSYQDSLKRILGTRVNGGMADWLIIDADGRELNGSDISPVQQKDGTWVFIIYAKANPDALIGSMKDCEGNRMQRIIMDAKNFRTLEISQYEKDFSKQNRMFTLTYSFEYANLSPDEALRRMTEAGFDIKHALPTMPPKRN
ncbi:MAG TPA: hypothetical protein VK978_03800 [Candidatus Saccharimonadales bacterium]|nr:hypothetical protein [Candidatus Saccharimonadales bacterium]